MFGSHVMFLFCCRFISNLDYKVTDDDVKELFTVCGDLKEHGIHYDKRWAAVPVLK